MQSKQFRVVVASLMIAAGVVSGACGGGASAEKAAAPGAVADADARPPSGAYESTLPDGTVIRLSFRSGGSVNISMTEDGKTDAHDGKWVVNGEVILVQGGEGMTLQLSWKGDALVTDFGGATLTFKKV